MKISQRRIDQIIINANLSKSGSLIESVCTTFSEDYPEEAETLARWLATDPAPSVEDLSEEDRLGYAVCVAQGNDYCDKYYYSANWGKQSIKEMRGHYNRVAKAVIDAYVSK